MSDPRHSQRATRALQKLAEEDPAFAALSLWCNHRDADLDGSAASSAQTILYGPQFMHLGLPEQMGLAAHHILHIALRHARRGAGLRTRLGDGFDQALFNLGADALINDTLSAIGLIQPRPHVTLATLDLPDDTVKSWDVERLYFMLAEREAQRSSAGDDTVFQRAQRDGFAEDLQLASSGQDEDGDQSPSEMDWRQALDRALDAGRAAGRGLGMMGHRLLDIPETTTPWEVLLRRLAARALQHAPHLSYRRPSGRWVAMEAEARCAGRPVPVFEPAQQRYRHQPRIVVGLDSSGSVSKAQLGLFGAQIGAIARRGGAELHLLVFDEAVRLQKILQDGDLPRALGTLDLSRDGGTDFRPVFDAAKVLAPSLIVMLSDLEGPLPDPAPKAPTLWAVPTAPASPPAFGKILVLDR